MTTRLVLGYALLVLLVAGCASAIWWAIYNSERNVRRRKRHARRAHRKSAEARDGAASDEADKLG
jgi:CHASE3 domain sensor protein